MAGAHRLRPGRSSAARSVGLSAVAALLIASCGYFNSLYNARRDFGQAREAERRGEDSAAATAYMAAIRNAASTWSDHGDSRWGDDALLLIGRARYALREYEAARAAFITLLEERHDGGLAPEAHAWLGASEAALGRPLAARIHLDSALAAQPSAEAAALARLWRGRLLFEQGDDGAWSDLEAAAASGTLFAPHANLTLATKAVAVRDTARTRVAFNGLYRNRTAARWADSVETLVGAASATFGPVFTRSAVAVVEAGDWPVEPTRRHQLRRALLAAESGDTALAMAEAIELADRGTSIAASARLAAARFRLAGVDDVAQLDEVRAMLLPVIVNAEAQQLVRDMRTVEVMLERALEDGQVLAVFAAAEVSRDRLGATGLANRLFIMYADLAPASVWAPKALIAAAALDDGSSTAEITARIRERPGNPYAASVLAGQSDTAEYESAEQRLRDNLTALNTEARRVASARDVRVGSVVARLDSIRAAALADSTRIECGILIDSLSLTGIRSDSIHAACMRSDSARVVEVLGIDTLLLIDTTAVRDTSRTRRSREPLSPFGRSSR